MDHLYAESKSGNEVSSYIKKILDNFQENNLNPQQLFKFSLSNDLNMLRLQLPNIINDKNQMDLLIKFAILNDQIQFFEYLKEINYPLSDAGDEGDTPLMFAICLKKYEIAKFFIQNFNDCVNFKNKNDLTALHLAVQQSGKEIVEFFLDNNAFIESCTSKGRTPLHIATFNNNIEIIELKEMQTLNVVIKMV